MGGWIWLWWIGAVVLAGVGTWLVLRGLFGHRRIASRTRRCPRCRYDMTGRPGEMTCAECGFTAKHESRLYGGRRRWWVAALGVSLFAGGLVMMIVPEIERHGVARVLLPDSVAERYWLELIRIGDRGGWPLVQRAMDRCIDGLPEPGDEALVQRAFDQAIEAVTNEFPSVEPYGFVLGVVSAINRGQLEVALSDTALEVIASRSMSDADSRRLLIAQIDRASVFEDQLRDLGAHDVLAALHASRDEHDAMLHHLGHMQPHGATRTIEWMLEAGLIAPNDLAQFYRDTDSQHVVALTALILTRDAKYGGSEDWSPIIREIVDRFVSDERSGVELANALEHLPTWCTPILGGALGGDDVTPLSGSRLISVLRRSRSDTSESLPFVEAYALDPDLPFDWAKRAAHDHLYIRSRFDAEDDYPPMFAMPIYRRALAATDWDDPDSVARLMVDWPPHRDDGTVALAELIAAGDPSPFVSALARDAAEEHEGDLIAELAGIARDDRVADETRDIARRLVSDLEDVWPGLVGEIGEPD